MIIFLTVVALVCSAIPCILFLTNLPRFMALPPPMSGAPPEVSVLIPARDEAGNLPAVLDSILSCRGINLEVLVLDDHSSDGTATVVQEFSVRDPRVRLIRGADLPRGWCGKNFACHQLAAAARLPLLVFIDADVRLSNAEALAGIAASMERNNLGLLSGIPRQITGTWMERLVIPLIHFVLLGFLPFRKMRNSTDPRFTAACGQLLAVRRDVIVDAGGYTVVAGRIHDAMALARLIRTRGFRTDVADLTNAAWCRMYDRPGAVWRGFAKNAHEGLGAPPIILPMSMFLLAGQVLPFVLVATVPTLPVAAAVCMALLPRLIGTRRWHQGLISAVLHPVGVLLLLATQWHGLTRHLAGRPVSWKGRPGARPMPPPA